MYDLDQKIEDYSRELFVDSGLVNLTEEQKADLYARVQEHFHKVIYDSLYPTLNAVEAGRLRDFLEQENYEELGEILRKTPSVSNDLEEKIDVEFKKLKNIIAAEQQNLSAK